jgi:hypothetical protein
VALIAFGFSDFAVVFVAVSAAKLAPPKARAVNAITNLEHVFHNITSFVPLDVEVKLSEP